MSIGEVRIAYWRIAHGPTGKELDLHPWLPDATAALKAATIRHCVGCATCGDAVEVDPPCDNPRWCNPGHPCEGLRTTLEWARGHVDGTAAAVVAAPRSAERPPVQRRLRWTAEEDAWLIAHPRASAKEIAWALGRTWAAAADRRRILGIAAPAAKPWSDYEDRLLRGCTSIRDALAMLPSRSRTAIKSRAGRIRHSLAGVPAAGGAA